MSRVIEKRHGLPTYAITCVALMVPMVLFYILNDRIMKSGLGYDEQLFAWGGWSITQGLRPYIDFLEFKPPMVFITYAMAIWTFGEKNTDFRIFFSLFAALSVIAIHVSLLSRRMNRAISTALVSALVFAWVNPGYHDNALGDAESIGLSFYFLGVAALIANVPKYRRYLQAIGGFFLACTVFSKEPYAGAVVGTWVSVFLLDYGTTDFRKNALQYFKRTGIGVAALLLVLCAYLIPTGSMAAYIHMVEGYAALYRNPSTSICVVFGRWAPSTPLRELKAQAKYIHEQFFNTATIGYLTPFFVASVVFLWRESRVLFAASSATALLALYSVTATNCQWPHYYNMALSGMFLFFVIGADRMNAELLSTGALIRGYVGAMLVAVIAIFSFPRVHSELRNWPYHFQPMWVPVSGVLEFVAANSSPGDRILTTGPPLIYMYTHRYGAVREIILDEFLMLYPGNTDVDRVRGLREELLKNRPKIVILDPLFEERKRRHMEALFVPFFRDFGYQKVGDYYYVRPD
jgi:hypothetical protein